MAEDNDNSGTGSKGLAELLDTTIFVFDWEMPIIRRLDVWNVNFDSDTVLLALQGLVVVGLDIRIGRGQKASLGQLGTVLGRKASDLLLEARC